MRMKIKTLTLILCLFTTTSFFSAQSQENASDSIDYEEDLLGGIVLKEPEFSDNRQQNYSMHGFFRQQVAYAFQSPEPSYGYSRADPGLSKLQSELNLDFEYFLPDEWKFRSILNTRYDSYYQMEGRESFTDETLDAYESEVRLRDVYFEGPLWERFWFKSGRMIDVWGESESAQIIDLLNPRDLREFGQQDVEDIRTPVWATKLQYSGDGWLADFIIVHENRPNQYATNRSDFDPYISIRDSLNLVGEEEAMESRFFEEPEFLFRYLYNLQGSDVSVVLGYVFNDALTLMHTDTVAASDKPTVTLFSKKVKVVGLAGNYVRGSWLVRSEMAWKSGVAVQNTDIFSVDAQNSGKRGWSEKDQVQGMAGATYTGIADLSVSIEGSFVRILDHESSLLQDSFTPSIVMTVLYDMFYQTLHNIWVVNYYPDTREWVNRLSAIYEYSDSVHFSGDIINYESSEETGFLYPYRNQDRIQLGIKYLF
jgi:hypothetical protein